MTTTSLDPSNGTCVHVLESMAAFTRITALVMEVSDSVRCNEGYTVCHLEVTFMLPSLSMYNSYNRSKSHFKCMGELMRSKCALSDLFRICCQIFNLRGDEPVSDDIRQVGLGWAIVCHVFTLLMGLPGNHPIKPRCRWTMGHGGRPCRVLTHLRLPVGRLEAHLKRRTK